MPYASGVFPPQIQSLSFGELFAPCSTSEFKQPITLRPNGPIIWTDSVIICFTRLGYPRSDVRKVLVSVATRENNSVASSAISRALAAWSCCCQETLTDRYKAINEAGVASMIFLWVAQTISSRSNALGSRRINKRPISIDHYYIKAAIAWAVPNF